MIIKTLEEALEYEELWYQYSHRQEIIYNFIPKDLVVVDEGEVLLTGKVSGVGYQEGVPNQYMHIVIPQRRLDNEYIILTTKEDKRKPNSPKTIPYQEGLV